VTITGTNLIGAGVTFGGVPGVVTSNTGTQIVVTAPSGTGAVNVVVTTPGGTAADIGAYTYIPASPNLTITVALVGTLWHGRTAMYDINVGNSGAGVATGPATVVDTLPSGLVYVGANGGGWTCSAAGRLVNCILLPDIAAGAVAPQLTLTVMVTGAAGTVVVNSVEVFGGTQAAVASAVDAISAVDNSDPVVPDTGVSSAGTQMGWLLTVVGLFLVSASRGRRGRGR
jgi:uncharacterized repeat protein (TIGR01451 family)